ncbi:unnamed protein product, partial [Vitrella brassicaformis CCMP3155]
AFEGSVDTNFIVKCPPGCAASDTDVAVYGGSGGLYSDDSSVCLAAIHSGRLTPAKGGIVNVAIETGRNAYEGSTANGITSQTKDQPTDRSILITPLPTDCPVESLTHTATTSSTTSSFIEVSSGASAGVDPSSSMAAMAGSEDEAGLMSLSAVTKRTLRLINQQCAKFDQHVVQEEANEARQILGECRSVLKRSVSLYRAQEARSEDLYEHVADTIDALTAVSERTGSALATLSAKLQQATDMQKAAHAFKDWRLDYDAISSFGEVFAVTDTDKATHAPSSWSITSTSDKPVGGRDRVIAQTSAIRSFGGLPGQGSLAVLKSHRSYDFRLTVEAYVESGPGTYGIAFRVRDPANMYLLDMTMAKSKRLIKIHDGQPSVIKEIHDGGYLPGTWYTYEITARQGHITVAAGASGSGRLVVVMSAHDSEIASGSVGLFTSGMHHGVFFDKVTVAACPCTKLSKLPPPPKPPKCSLFREDYYGRFELVYHLHEPVDSQDGPSEWRYRDHIHGRTKTLAQLSAVSGKEGIGTHVLLKGHRTCRDGRLSVDLLPECDGDNANANAAVGVVFRHIDNNNFHLAQVSPSALKLRRVTAGQAADVATNPNGGWAAGKWHTLDVTFNGPIVNVRLSRVDEGPSSVCELSVSDPFAHTDGAVGLSSNGCGGVAFDTFKLMPSDLTRDNTAPPPTHNTSTTTATTATSGRSAGHSVCASAVHFRQRQQRCAQLVGPDGGEGSGGQCRSAGTDFCTSCCKYHTALLPSSVGSSCESACRANDDLAAATETALAEYASACATDSALFAHCISKDDSEVDVASCVREACELCCQTSAHHPLAMGEERQWETDTCKQQCNGEGGNTPLLTMMSAVAA